MLKSEKTCRNKNVAFKNDGVAFLWLAKALQGF